MAAPDPQTETLTIEAATALITQALEAAGAPTPAAASVARALVAAEAEGQVGHGFSRLADYAAQVKSGKVRAGATPVCNADGPGALHVDAGDGFAYPALELAIAQLCGAAEAQGCAMVSITRSHHCGALSIQVEKIAQAGLIGIMMANSPPAIAPWGSHQPVFGTNPIAFAAPRRDAPPLVIDLSLSRVARGKVMHAKKSGAEIPLGWALDAAGAPTSDPEAALAGSMVPIGEAKGSALALMVEILVASLAGANPSREVASFFTADGPPSGAGQFLMALRPREGFAARIEPLLNHIASLDGTRLPGKRRAEAIAQAHANGLSVPRHYLDAARAMAAAGG
ncbi:MAG: Ldh family oxidoreductase [Pseudomonadota bacterium]